MRIISILLLSFLFSCNFSKENEEKPIPDPSLENPWTYINRISDTLPETEFSLFNSMDKNKSILEKFGTDFLEFKYQVGNGKYMKVLGSRINNQSPGCWTAPFPFEIKVFDNDTIFIDDFLIINKNQIDTINYFFTKRLLEPEHVERNRYLAMFSIKCSQFENQELVAKIIDQISIGYYKFVLQSMKKENNKLNSQEEIMKLIPLTLVYQFSWPPQIQAKFKNQ